MPYTRTYSLNDAPGGDLVKEAIAGLDTDLTGAFAHINSEETNRISADGVRDAAIALKAPLSSPAFTDTPTAPTPALGTNTDQLATTAFVTQEMVQAGSYPTPGVGDTGKFLRTDGWALTGNILRSARTSNTILSITDKNSLVDITSGTFTQTFEAAATLGNGWSCYIRNSGTGDITLDPNASELIDGLASYVMYPGESRLITCDGVGFYSVVVSSFYKVFTTTGSFVKPPGYSAFNTLTWGGGSSGQKSGSNSTLSVGGGGGGCFPATLPASALSASTTITIGAGGAARSTATTGAAGGASSIGTLVVVGSGSWSVGGSVNVGGSVIIVTGVDGSSLQGDAVGFESPAARTTARRSIYGGGTPSSDASAAGQGALYGGGCGGSLNASATLRAPGASLLGGSGGAAASMTSGVDGTAPGGGGGATQEGTSSGAGARGEVRIWGQL